MASSVFSENGRPASWMATGSLPAKPQGSESAGMPARFPAAMSAVRPGFAGALLSGCRSSGCTNGSCRALRGDQGATQGEFVLRLVMPHFRLSQQSPAFKGMKYRALTAQRLHRAVANEVLHVAPPTPCPE